MLEISLVPGSQKLQNSQKDFRNFHMFKEKQEHIPDYFKDYHGPRKVENTQVYFKGFHGTELDTREHSRLFQGLEWILTGHSRIFKITPCTCKDPNWKLESDILGNEFWLGVECGHLFLVNSQNVLQYT